jgi:hypothetical protein
MAGRGIGTAAQPEAGPGGGAGSGDAGRCAVPAWPTVARRRCPAPTVLCTLPALPGEAAGAASRDGPATADAQYYPSLQSRLLLPSKGDRQAASRKG